MIDFSKKRFLIVDDFAEFRSSVRGILQLLGVQQIDTAANGEDVLELCRRNRYDVILHDYNLGEGVSGQQVLEQLHNKGLLSAHCIFIMVTAENTQAMVLAALECKPDDYLTKPFNKDTLHTRLERLLRRKNILKPVLDAVERKQPAAVLDACAAIEQKEPRHAVLCLNYKASALEQLARYQELEQLLEQQARSRPSSWSLRELANLWLAQGREDQLGGLLTAAIRQFPMLPELHDTKANLAARNMDLEQEQQALLQAVALSPNNLHRQIRLAHQAWLNQQPDIAINALRQCWENGRHSLLFDAQLLWQLVSMLANGTHRQKEEVAHWIRIIERQHSRASNTRAAIALLKLAQRKKSAQTVTPAEQEECVQELIQYQSSYSGVSLLQIGDWLQQLGSSETANAFWLRSAERYALIPGILTQVKQRYPQLSEQQYLQAHQLCKQAIAQHLGGQPDTAQTLFEQALKLAPHLVQLNIAAAKLALDQLRQGENGARERLQSCFDRIGQLPAIDLQTHDYNNIKAAQEQHSW